MSTQGNPSTQLRKVTTIESVASLAANGVFTGAWHDSQVDGTLYVVASSFSNVAGASNAIMLQESDDITNANFTRNLSGTIGAVGANILTRTSGFIKARYWRVVYTNGATIQGSFELTSTSLNVAPFANVVVTGSPDSGLSALIGLISSGTISIPTLDNNLVVNRFSDNVGNGAPVEVATCFYGGRFTGAADAIRQGSSLARTPTVFKPVTTAATGSTAIWLPGVGNKFRLLRYRITVGASAIMAAATDLTIKLLDSALDIGQNYIVRIPAAALASGVNYDTGWVDLGGFGILSAAINQTLNVNLSAALTGGLISVIVAGTEE